MPALEIPSWIQAADPASHMARGLSIGVQLGAQQAEERYRQASMAQKAQQEAAQMSAQQAAQQFEQQFRMQEAARKQSQDAIAHQEFQQQQDLAATSAAKKFEAIQNYQNAVSGGMDPNTAMLTFGPAMGQGTAEAAAIRAHQQSAKEQAIKPVPMPEVMQMDIGGGKTYPVVVDKKTGRPTIIPPQAVFPSAKGVTAKGGITDYQRQNLIDRIDKEIDKLHKANSSLDLNLDAPDKSWSARKQSDFLRLKQRIAQLEQRRSQLEGDQAGDTSDTGDAGADTGNPYKVGGRYGNLRYKGGDPNDESSWEKVE